MGYRAAIVEKWNPFAKVRQDLYNIGDVLGLKAGEPLLLIQTTVTAKLNARMRKDPETVAQWVSTGNRFQYWGWSKGGKKGQRKTWQLTVRSLNAAA